MIGTASYIRRVDGENTILCCVYFLLLIWKQGCKLLQISEHFFCSKTKETNAPIFFLILKQFFFLSNYLYYDAMEVQFRFKVYRITISELFMENGNILWVLKTMKYHLRLKVFRISWNLIFMKNGIHLSIKLIITYFFLNSF